MKPNAKTSYALKLILTIVVLPLLFVAIGGWQLSRVPTAENYQAEREEIRALIDSLKDQAKKNPYASIKGDDGKSYSIGYALSDLRKQEASLSGGFGSSPVTGIVAKFEIVVALLSALIGGLGLVVIRRMGQSARTSRETLLHSFKSGQKILPWIIGSSGFLLPLALAAAIAFELAQFIATGDTHSRGSAKLIMIGIVIMIVVVVIAFQVVWKMFRASGKAFQSEPIRLMGRSIGEQEAPALWAFVRKVADKAKATMPNAIIIGLNECFFVTEHPVQLLSGEAVPTGRVLYLPVPYMAFMSQAETAAVIGHELGHFLGEDTEYSLHFSPIYASAVRNLEALLETTGSGENSGWIEWLTKPAFMLGLYFLESFDLAVQHWSRIRELAADRVGASVAGSQAIGLSLLRISVLAPPINDVLNECWEKGGKLEEGVLERIKRLVKEKGLSDPRGHLEDSQSHPTDSHPPISQRLQALELEVSDELVARAQNPANSLLLQELGLSHGENEQTTDGQAPQALSTGLEAEFTQTAREQNEAIRQHLEELASRGQGSRPVYEGGTLTLIIFFLFALIFFVVAGHFIMDNASPNATKIVLGTLAAGAACLGLFAYFLRRRRKPFVTLTAEGLLFADMAQALPWTAVENWQINVNTYNGMTTLVSLQVDIADGYPVPAFSGDRRVKYKPKKQKLFFSILNFRGKMNADQFNELFATYLNGGIARERLAKMG